MFVESGKFLDFAYLDRRIEEAAHGVRDAALEVRSVLAKLAEVPSKWQWVIHGETQKYRSGVVHWLCDHGEFARAKKLACCGRGDGALLSEAGDSAKVVTRCCGFRFCPRCSRRSGQRVLRRLGAHLSHERHGPMDHMVLTQRVVSGEPLERTMERFKRKWLPVHRVLKRVGVRSALVTYHVKRSRWDGWHYHAHCVLEWSEGADRDAGAKMLIDMWLRGMQKAQEGDNPPFVRKLCDAGDAIEEMEAKAQGEFWKEAGDPVAVCLQYALRDVLQGCESWVADADDPGLVDEFMSALKGAKLHRLYGEWRKRVKDVAEVAESDIDAKEGESDVAAVKGDKVCWVSLGTVDHALTLAEQGVSAGQTWARSLSLLHANRSALSLRLVALLRARLPARAP